MTVVQATAAISAADDLDRLLARADAYRELAAVFCDPDGRGPVEEPGMAQLRSAARRLALPVDARWWRALRGIARREVRAAEHRTIFGHVVAHGCPPYETEYDHRHVFAQSQLLGDIRGFYEAFGVRPRRGGERPDHLACELEFLSLLSLKEALALARGEAERRAICRDAAARFIEDHAGRWLAALAGRIARRAPGSGYAAAAAIGAALVACHADDVGALPSLLGPDELVAIPEQPDGFSFECGNDEGGGDMTPPA